MSTSLRIKDYVEYLRNNYQQIRDLLRELDNNLGTLKELVKLARELKIQIPKKFPITSIDLDPQKLNGAIELLRKYSNDIFLAIMSQLLPGLYNDIDNSCEIVTDMIYGYKNTLNIFISNVRELWNYRDELKYLSLGPCFKGYCDFINKVINDRELKEAVRAIHDINNVRKGIVEVGDVLPIAKELDRCVSNIISNVAKECQFTLFNDVKKSLGDTFDLLTYFNDMINVVNGMPNLQYDAYSQPGYCLEILKIFNNFMNTIRGISFDELNTVRCNTLDELTEFNKKVEDKKERYIDKIRESQKQIMNYLSSLERVISNNELREKFRAKRNSLEVSVNRFISEVSGKNVERERIKEVVNELLRLYQDISQFICTKLISGLGLKDEELKVIIRVIERGGDVDLKDLRDINHDVIIELCEKGILRCKVSLW